MLTLWKKNKIQSEYFICIKISLMFVIQYEIFRKNNKKRKLMMREHLKIIGNSYLSLILIYLNYSKKI